MVVGWLGLVAALVGVSVNILCVEIIDVDGCFSKLFHIAHAYRETAIWVDTG